MELGIDFEKFESQLQSKSDKGRALQGKIVDDTLEYIKSKFKLSETSAPDALRNLWVTNKESCKDLYILCNSAEDFKEEVIKKYYKKRFGNVHKSLLYMLIKAFFEDYEITKQMHYASLLASKKLTSAVPDTELSNVRLDKLKEEDFEKLAKLIYQYDKSQKTVCVWYVLRDDDAVTIFIYKNCKSRAKIPSTEKRKYQFIKHSRPIILRFSEDANLLEISANSNEQAYRMASQIVSPQVSTADKQLMIRYSQKEILTTKKDLTAFKDACVNDKDSTFTLIELTCKPKDETIDSDIVFIRHRDPLKDIINMVEKALSTNISVDKISSIKLKFKDKQFSLIFTLKENNSILVAYSSQSSDVSLNREFKETLEKNYKVKIIRRG